jgi:hypothetical protein
MEKVYLYLTGEEKTWLNFSQHDSLQFSDSLGNVIVFRKNKDLDTFALNCYYYEQNISVNYYNIDCPVNLKFQLTKTSTTFYFAIRTGLLNEYTQQCYSNFTMSDFGSSQSAFYDSLDLRSFQFYNVYKFSDISRTLYYTKDAGIIAFTRDNLLWIQTQ